MNENARSPHSPKKTLRNACLLLLLAASLASAAMGEVIHTVDRRGFTGAHSSLALDSAGMPVIAYRQDNGLKLAFCQSVGCRGRVEFFFQPAVGTSLSEISLALDAVDNPVVSYYDDGLKILRCGDPTCSSGNIVTPIPTVSLGDRSGRYGSLKLDVHGYPVVSYQRDDGLSRSSLAILHCGDPTCDSYTITTPDPQDEWLGWFGTSLELDGNGYPVVSYHTRDFKRLKILHCSDASCSPNEEHSVTTPVTDGSSYSSLELDADGYPVVTYYANGTIKVLHCSDANCSPEEDHSITTPLPVPNNGVTNSLKLDGNGFPVVSYYASDATHSTVSLNILHCGDATCSPEGIHSITAPDAPRNGNVGSYSSLQLDRYGYPIVSYHDFDYRNYNLKILFCDDPSCSP